MKRSKRIRPHNTGDKIEPQEIFITAYYVYKIGVDEKNEPVYDAEEMDFLMVSGTSQADLKDYAQAWAEENLTPGWERIEFGQPSCGLVRY